MKTYEQMAQDALARIDEERRAYGRRRQKIIRTAVVLGCAVLTATSGAVVPFLTNKQQPLSLGEAVKPITTSVVQVAYLSENGWDRSAMEQQTETAMRYKLSVVDTRGLTATQREALRQEMVAKQEKELLEFIPDFYEGKTFGGGGVNSGWDNVLFETYRVGVFEVDIDEKKAVESFRTECSSVYGEAELCLHSTDLVGQPVTYRAKWADTEEQLVESTEIQTRHANIYLHAMAVELDGDTYDRVTENGFYHIRWKPSSKLYETLNADPLKPLSDFSDQMTITVRYTDGTKEEHRIDMVFHDDGNIGAVYRGAVTE